MRKMTMFADLFKPRICWEAEDEGGAGGSSLVGEDTTSTGEDTLESGAGDDTTPSGDGKSLIDTDEDEPTSDFDTPVEPEAFKESLGEDFEITDEEAFGKFLETVNN